MEHGAEGVEVALLSAVLLLLAAAAAAAASSAADDMSADGRCLLGPAPTTLPPPASLGSATATPPPPPLVRGGTCRVLLLPLLALLGLGDLFLPPLSVGERVGEEGETELCGGCSLVADGERLLLSSLSSSSPSSSSSSPAVAPSDAVRPLRRLCRRRRLHPEGLHLLPFAPLDSFPGEDEGTVAKVAASALTEAST